MVSGSGTIGDPFILTSFADLELIGTVGYSLSAYYRLGADIDMSATQDPGYNGGSGWLPIGDSVNPFTGGFDGAEYEISGLYINRSASDNIGFFGVANSLGSPPYIRNINFNDVEIIGRNNVGLIGTLNGYVDSINANTISIQGDQNCGGVAGDANTANPMITNCNLANADINNSGTGTGGIIGHIYILNAIITDCEFSGNVNGVDYVGGIVGLKDFGNVAFDFRRNSVYGLVSGRDCVGGMIGHNGSYNRYTYIYGEDCVLDCTIQSNGKYVGGVAGMSHQNNEDWVIVDVVFDCPNADYVGGVMGYTDTVQPTFINRCYVLCDVSGRDCVGGLVGGSPASNVSIGIHNGFFYGTVSGRDNIGGVIGYHHAYNSGVRFYRCYSKGNVIASGTMAGGIVGSDGTRTISDCFSFSNVYCPNGVAGGFAGGKTGRGGGFERCYSKGSVNGLVSGGFLGSLSGTYTIVYCYWDVETSGQSWSAAGTGKTTAEMLLQSTYETFDFVNVWIMDLYNDGYPHLFDSPLILEMRVNSGLDVGFVFGCGL